MLSLPLLRAVLRMGGEDDLALASNLFHLRNELEVDGVDGALTGFVADLFDKTQQVPPLALVRQHCDDLVTLGDGRGPAGLLRLDEVVAAGLPFQTGPEFRYALDSYKQALLKETVSQLLLETSTIVTTGVQRTRMVNGARQTELVQGPGAAVEHMAETLANLNRQLRRGAIEGSFRKDADDLVRDYEFRKAHPHVRFGVQSGIDKIDTAHKGIGIGELALVMGFVGHYKSTFCLNWAYKAAVWYGKTVCIVSGETPVKKFRDALYVMHAGHEKFLSRRGFLTIDYEKVKSGLLSDEEEAFFREVIADLQTNPAYGEIFYREPEDTITIASVQQWAETKDRIRPVDLIFLDYLGLCDPGRSGMKGLEQHAAINMVIRQAKLMSMAFARGRGVALLSPFQVNREGLKDAEKNGGKYSLRALSGANEAERSSDLIYYIYVDDTLRGQSRAAIGNLKTRDVPLIIDQFQVFANPATRVINNADLTAPDQVPVTMEV